jgi:hypothetical protein
MNIKKTTYLIYLLPQLGFGAHNYFYLFGTIFGFNSSCQNNVFFFNRKSQLKKLFFLPTSEATRLIIDSKLELVTN